MILARGRIQFIRMSMSYEDIPSYYPCHPDYKGVPENKRLSSGRHRANPITKRPFKKLSEIKFSSTMTKCDPRDDNVTIIGRLEHLRKLSFEMIKIKLGSCVSEETYLTAIESLQPSPTDSCPLYLNLASVVALPSQISRHNTPSRAHSITKIVSGLPCDSYQHIVILCEKSDVFASALAIARAFPLYSKKTMDKKSPKFLKRRKEIMAALEKERAELAKTQEVKPREFEDLEALGPVVYVEFLIVSEEGVGVQTLTENELKLLHNSSEAVRGAAEIVDTPCSEMDTGDFLAICRQMAKRLNVNIRMFYGDECEEKGLGGIHGVGKAADKGPPCLIILSHCPKGATKSVAWVGKGIVFDTGGLSIKDRTGMCGMKRDCGGAAAVLYAFQLAVQEGFTQNLHAVMCMAENAVGPLATRPDDILYMYSRKTVEVNNTDAEGRLVLADGVVFAQRDLKADIIVDVATLTGAQGITTGKYHAALLTNSEEWESAGVRAGKTCGDLVFPIVFTPELHFSEFNSTIADMKNSAKNRNNAGASCAGLFIFSHLGFDFPGIWVHLDIAYPAEADDKATGYGVALLSTLFGNMSESPFLQSLSPWPVVKK